jgi:hypothetical protein
MTDMMVKMGLLDYTPQPREDEDYETYLDRCGVLGDGFRFGEIVRPRSWRKHRMPPMDLWARMGPTLGAANILRRMVAAELPSDFQGLRVAAAYRPWGGARRSQHKSNAALDLDLMPDNYDQAVNYYRVAVRMWCQYGTEMKMGLGLYTAGRGGIRVHIDTGYRARTWQISRGKSIRPHHVMGAQRPLAYALANQMGLTVPS